MKRAGGLWQELIGWPNLETAVRRAARGKRSRPDVAAFLLDWEGHLIQLRRELAEDAYKPGAYRSFRVMEPKPRNISAAPFRDRVVHHALTQVLEPVFEPRFSHHSYACRTGYGTHRAIHAASRGASAFPWALRCDVRKYFASIDHAILKDQVARSVKCMRTLSLVATIIDGSNPQEDIIHYYSGDDLFTPFERRGGIPLGNQTSQFFANVHLNGFDHFVEREIRPRGYVRYVDYFALFHESYDFLAKARADIEKKLSMLRLSVHPRKTQIQPTRGGITFLGWRIFPDRLRLVRSNVVGFRRRIKQLHAEFRDGRINWADVLASLQAWNAHAQTGNTWRLREAIFDAFDWS